jgi:hypothetical protein
MKWLIAFVVSLFSMTVSASDNCHGKITEIMGHSSQDVCGGRLAFKLSVIGAKYLCSLTEQTDSMLLLAYGGKRSVLVRIELPVDNNCASLQTLPSSENYFRPNYILLLDQTP